MVTSEFFLLLHWRVKEACTHIECHAACPDVEYEVRTIFRRQGGRDDIGSLASVA
jgi:hypothetical protein